MKTARALVLFDIDGTLLRRAGPHHKQALMDAIRKVSGFETSFEGVETSGRLDRDLIRTLLRSKGARLRDIDRWMPDIVERAQNSYESICPPLHDRTCPGVADFLEALHAAEIAAGLVTGNLTAIGWKKMDAAGLRRFFAVGAFSEMARTRAGLAKIAVREARRKGIAGQGTTVSLIGDHPNDVEAAKINGIQSIAVTTGFTSREELAACSPDYVVDDLRSVELEWLY